jgi:hypothetical protein
MEQTPGARERSIPNREGTKLAGGRSFPGKWAGPLGETRPRPIEQRAGAIHAGRARCDPAIRRGAIKVGLARLQTSSAVRRVEPRRFFFSLNRSDLDLEAGHAVHGISVFP